MINEPKIFKKLIKKNYTKGRNGYAGNKNYSILGVTMHTTAGTGDLYNYFNINKKNISANYCIRKDGRIEEYVKPENTAHANGCEKANSSYISIEHEDQGRWNDINIYSDKQKKASAHLIAWLSQEYNFPLKYVKPYKKGITKHRDFDGITKPCPGSLPVNAIINRAKEMINVNQDNNNDEINININGLRFGQLVSLTMKTSLKKNPGENEQVITSIDENAVGLILCNERIINGDGWIRIKFADHEGWALAKYMNQTIRSITSTKNEDINNIDELNTRISILQKSNKEYIERIDELLKENTQLQTSIAELDKKIVDKFFENFENKLKVIYHGTDTDTEKEKENRNRTILKIKNRLIGIAHKLIDK